MFTITITKIEEVQTECGQEWQQGAGADGGYGYTPKITKLTKVVTKLYEQTTPDLYLRDIISAINGLDTEHPE